MEQIPLFLYGTLKAGGSLDSFSVNERVIIEAELKGAALYDLGAFPGLKLDAKSTVKGEVHIYKSLAAYKKVLKILDFIEGYKGRRDDLFKRVIVEVRLASGETTEAFAYLYNRPVSEEKRIASGRWPRPSRL